MGYQRCFSTLGCPESDLGEVFALARRHDVNALELRALGGTIDLPQYFEERYARPEELAAHVDELRANGGARIVAVDTSVNLSQVTPQCREALAAHAVWATACGASWLRLFDGDHAQDPAAPALMREFVAWWRGEKQRRGWKVDIMIETHSSLLTGAAVRAFGQEFPDVSVLWDAHHTWRLGNEDPVVTWEAMRERVVHIHIKDSVSTAGRTQYVVPGNGDFPLASFLGRLRQSGFVGAVSLEWERLWHPEIGSLDAALEAARRGGW